MAERSPVSELPLSISLHRLWRHVGSYADAGEALRLSADAAASLSELLGTLYQRAIHLEMRAAAAEELEAVARDLDLIAFAKSGEIGPVELTAAGYAALGITPGVGPLMGEVVEVDAFRQRQEARRLRESVAADQRALQAALDAGDEDAAVALAGMMQIADTLDLVLGRGPDGPPGGAPAEAQPADVVIFPGVRRSRVAAPDDGDAA